MKYKGLSFLIVGICFAGAAALFASCTSNDSTPAPSSGNMYQGPGSHYTVASSGATYTFTKYANAGATTADFTVTATGADVNGFKKFTVTGVTGTGGPTVGATVYGFEVPGMALFVKPIDASSPDQVLVAVAAGSCPTTTFHANYIKVKVKTGEDLSSTSQDAFGTFTYDPTATTPTATLPAKFSLAAPTTACTTCGSSSFSSASCTGGVMRVANSSDFITIYLSTVGAAIVDTSDTGGNADFIFGMPQPSSALTLSTFNGIYSGLYYSAAAASGSRLKPIKVTMTATNATTLTGSGSELSDVVNDTTTGSAATLTLTPNASYPGILTGSLTTSGTTNIACLAMPNANGSGKQVLDCAGIDPGAAGALFNFLLVSR